MTVSDTGVSTLLGLASDPSLIGREMRVFELGAVRRGPISSIVVEDQEEGGYLVIRLAWLFEATPWDHGTPWARTPNGEFTYEALDGWSSVRYKDNGAVDISTRMAWSGQILPVTADRLPMPSA